MPYVDVPAKEKIKPALNAARDYLKSILDLDVTEVTDFINTVLSGLRRGSSQYLGTNTLHRNAIDAAIDALIGKGKGHPGWLNCYVCCVCWEHVFDSGRGLSYSKLDELMGILDELRDKHSLNRGTIVCIMAEIYRRIGVPYEEQKIAENGDVFITP